MLRLAAAQGDAAGYVVACYGDPGLHALRDQTSLPVVGIQEASVMSALSLGQRFGVISILAASIPRHMRAFGAMGVMDRLAGDRALGLGVLELADRATTLNAMIATGQRLRDEDGRGRFDHRLCRHGLSARTAGRRPRATRGGALSGSRPARHWGTSRLTCHTEQTELQPMLNETANGVYTIAVTPFSSRWRPRL